MSIPHRTIGAMRTPHRHSASRSGPPGLLRPPAMAPAKAPAEAGHVVQAWGAPVARAALAQFCLEGPR
jgi:hypothetical protein